MSLSHILLVCSSTFVFTPFDTGTATGKVSGLSARRAAPRRRGTQAMHPSMLT